MVNERFVISARIIGGVRRDAPKLKTFMVSVSWSDRTEVIIYRSFRDFKEFHRQLKKRFPHLNPFRKTDRVIPKFNWKSRKSSLSQKGSKKSIQRMRFLESYCDKLLKCDQTVTLSTEVSRFFAPKDQDLQPDFTKNSIMILLSEDLPDGSGAATLQHAGSITQPFVTQTYRCVANYETKDTKNRPFKVAVDEKLDVLIKDPAGWWLVENEAKHLAWFPAPYLELWDGEDDDDAGFQLGGLYCAVRSYTTKEEDELSVSIGAVVEVLRKSDNGWWLIRFNGKTGYIPTMYLQPYNNPRTGFYSLQRKLHSSTMNLATSLDSRHSSPRSINEENSPQQDYAGPSRREPSFSGRLHKARSLDVLSEPWLQTQAEQNASDGFTHSARSSLSDFSSSSDSTTSLRGQQPNHAGHQAASRQPKDSMSSSSDLSLSNSRTSSTSSDGSSVAPRVPPRPKTEEIMTRCTTMTRKAALSTKTRLQSQHQYRHSRV